MPHRDCHYDCPPVFVLLLRNPYAWLSSTSLLPYTGCSVRVNKNFSGWVRRPFATYGMCKPERVRPTPMHVWNELSVAYQTLTWRQAVLVRDDEMLSESRLLAKIREIGALLGQTLPAGLRLPRQLPSVRKGLQPWTPETYAKEALKLKRRPWRRAYTEADLAWVNSQLSDEAMRGFERARTLNTGPYV